MQTFEQLGVSTPTVAALKERGITSAFEIQERVLPDALQGLDVLAKSPTGSGKTLAFAIPIVDRLSKGSEQVGALVLVPTRELAAQVAEEFASIGKAHGLKVAAVYGGASLSEQIKAVGRSQIVVATPGRLNDLIERKAIDLRATSFLVLDEADRMLDMGFKPQVERIIRRLPERRQTMLFSATLNDEVTDLARAYTNHPVRIEGSLPETQKQGAIEHRFMPVSPEEKLPTLVKLLGESEGLSLIFVRTKRGADRLSKQLAREGVRSEALHGDLGQGARERALKRFASGQVRTLVATDVAARGLDLEEITHVINFDPPDEASTYTHRVGRTGRAGRSGVGITLVLPEQQGEVGRVARLHGQAESFESSGMKAAKPKLVYSSRRGGRGRRW